MMKKRQTYPQWQALIQHQQQMASTQMRELFAKNSDRFDRYSLKAPGVFLDYSKNIITDNTLSLLFELALACNLKTEIENLFSGKIVNDSEQRPALHMQLRNPSNEQVLGVKQKMHQLTKSIITQEYRGYTGKPITDIIHVGIGGSELGPKMIYDALHSKNPLLRCHFISNHDDHAIERILSELDPQTTIAIFVSKTFTTQETLSNAEMVKNWFMCAAEKPAEKTSIQKQLFAVTTAVDRANAFGILSDAIFPFWEWVGGRYSVWSAVSLSSAIALGMDDFELFLSGAHAMDQHFQSAAFSENMPVILGLLGIWYNNFFDATTQAIIPYSQQLRYFPDFLQQLQMESQGKSVTRDGEPIDYKTGPILWGGVGTNSQHSFHQLLFQGSQFVPIDFILPVNVNAELVANCLAQSRTFMEGYWDEDIEKDCAQKKNMKENNKKLIPHKRIRGNCPSNTFLLDGIDPYSLGALMALYEHKVYVQSVIWDINPFDQWGVERGKVMAKSLMTALLNDGLDNNADASTNGLLKKLNRSTLPI